MEQQTEISNPQMRNPEQLRRYKLHRRFDRFGRLVGDEAISKLMNSHVMVIGLGGVGSWCAETLARSAIGKLTLVDFDEICVTNFNRQVHATMGKVGDKKSDIMVERCRDINPDCELLSVPLFYDESISDDLFQLKPDFIIDAIDSISHKCHLLDQCKKRNIPVISATGSGGRMDPTKVVIKDIAQTHTDPLAKDVRRILRQKYGFSKNANEAFGIPAVYSTEEPMDPVDVHYDGGKGFQCVCPQGENSPFGCEKRNLIFGNAGFVTGAFGLACTSFAVQTLIKSK